jgi:hypothetical protein
MKIYKGSNRGSTHRAMDQKYAEQVTYVNWGHEHKQRRITERSSGPRGGLLRPWIRQRRLRSCLSMRRFSDSIPMAPGFEITTATGGRPLFSLPVSACARVRVVHCFYSICPARSLYSASRALSVSIRNQNSGTGREWKKKSSWRRRGEGKSGAPYTFFFPIVGREIGTGSDESRVRYCRGTTLTYMWTKPICKCPYVSGSESL